MLPARPLSTIPSGEMLSSRQPFSAAPSDSTRELVPVTAKIAMRKSGPITTPVSLTSRNGESASLAEDAVSERALCRAEQRIGELPNFRRCGFDFRRWQAGPG